VVILQTSRLERWKGHGLLLQALALLKEAGGWSCWIAGGAQRPAEETYLRELQGETERLGLSTRVRFIGQRADIPGVLAAADIHCQPNTLPEPFGIAFVEALQAGLPVVTTALGGALEIVDESCGLLVPPGDPARLAGALKLLIAEPARRRRLSAGGPPRARTICAPGVQLGKLHAALTAIASKKEAA
jgi:glycosyltransferase involved in cell wall biosynthesis